MLFTGNGHYLSGEGGGRLGGIVLAVSTHVSTTDVLHGDVLHVEANVVTRGSFVHGGVMHLHRLDLSCDDVGGEGDNHTGLDDTGLHTAHGDRSNT